MVPLTPVAFAKIRDISLVIGRGLDECLLRLRVKSTIIDEDANAGSQTHAHQEHPSPFLRRAPVSPLRLFEPCTLDVGVRRIIEFGYEQAEQFHFLRGT